MTQKKYNERLKQKLLFIYGNKCNMCFGSRCFNINLEFAHLKPTKLSGSSRGQRKRLYDIKNNQECYTLLGRNCHLEYDTNV